MPLDLITVNRPHLGSNDRNELLQAAIDLLESADAGARESLEEAFLFITLRALETKILSDKELRTLALHWKIRRSEADEIIDRRMSILFGAAPSHELRAYLKKCIKSHSSTEAAKEGITDFSIREVLEDAISSNSKRELRCFYCGYHFRREDVSEKRQALVEQLDPVYSKTIHPLRLADTLKLWSYGNTSFTHLSIDHMTPEAGFGWTSRDNLVACCAFCNQGKKIYRRSTEPISTIIAGSLQACPAKREHSTPRHIAIFSAITFRNKCGNCNRGPSDVELTVQLPDETIETRWLAPWVLRVLCYDCLPHDAT